jgi:hypothetical protein
LNADGSTRTSDFRLFRPFIERSKLDGFNGEEGGRFEFDERVNYGIDNDQLDQYVKLEM